MPRGAPTAVCSWTSSNGITYWVVDGAHTTPIESDVPVATTGAAHFAGEDAVLAAAIALPDAP
jgi:hypothetical protein